MFCLFKYQAKIQFFGKIQPILDTEKWLKLRILKSLTRLFIILVSLTSSLFSEKCLFLIDALVV